MNRLTDKTLERNNIELIAKDEVFAQIPNWNKYFISNYGRLLHKKKNRYTIVNPSITGGGYLTYTLSKPARKYNGKKVRKSDGTTKGRKMTITANRLVGLVFVKFNPYEKRYNYSIEYLDTHHKDHNRQNNYFKNIMWLSNGKAGTRSDHKFVNDIKRIAVYNKEYATYHTYKDIEQLCNRIDTDILELIDILKDSDTPKIQDGKWTTCKVKEYYVGVQFR